MSLSVGLSGAKRATSVSRVVAARTGRTYAEGPSSTTNKKGDEEDVPPLPRVKFHPRAGFTKAPRPSPFRGTPTTPTPKPPPFQIRSEPSRTSLEDLQRLFPRPDPAAVAADAAADDAATAAAAAPSLGSEPASQPGPSGFASSRNPLPSSSATRLSTASSFSASPRDRARTSPPPPPPSSAQRSPKTAHDDPHTADGPLEDTKPLQPIIWGFFGLVVGLYVYEKGTSLGWFGPEGGASYMKDDRRAKQDEIAQKRREQWLEEVRLERLAKLQKDTAPSSAPAAPVAQPVLEVERVAPAAVQAISTEQVEKLKQGAQADEGGAKKRWWFF